MTHKLLVEEHEPDHPKGTLWSDVRSIYRVESKLKNRTLYSNIVFVQSALYHVSYAYSCYLSIMSLYVSTDIDRYDIRIYCTDNLQPVLLELFENFTNITIIVYNPIMSDVCLDEITYDDDDLVIKTQYWRDEELLKYDLICGIDADLFATGQGGSFALINKITDGIYLTTERLGTALPTTYDAYIKMITTLNYNVNKDSFPARIDDCFDIDVESITSKRTTWGNASLYVVPTKYIKNDVYKFLEILNFWFSEPCMCDESFLLIFSLINNIPIENINRKLFNMNNHLEHSELFNNKTIPMHLVQYNQPSALTHRVSTINSCRELAPRFNEYIDDVVSNFCKKYGQ